MYKIIVDSCGELPEEQKQDGHFQTVSLELEVDGYRIPMTRRLTSRIFCAG